MIFRDRTEAGTLLAEKLRDGLSKGTVVVGLARGGVLVAASIAKRLTLAIGVLVVKKLPSPYEAELGIGAVAPDRVTYIDWKLATSLGIDEVYVQEQIQQLSEAIKVKDQFYRKTIPHTPYTGRTIILADDGAATGATVRVAIKWFRTKNVAKIILALPVAPSEFLRSIQSAVDDLVVLDAPEDLRSVGQFYTDFTQLEDADVVRAAKGIPL
jgi:putative phosphoribosyl transferase